MANVHPFHHRHPRRKSRVLLACLLAVVLVIVAALVRSPEKSRASVSDGTLGKTAAMVVSMDGSPLHVLANLDFGRIRQTGVNTVVIYTVWDIDSPTQTRLSPGTMTIPDADVMSTMIQARAASLQPVLHPIFECRQCGNPWRGRIHPTDLDAFFASYRAMVDHYADLANSGGSTMFIIGSEMNSMQPDTDRWRDVVRDVRGHFSGKLTYVANWDAIGSVGFWDALDFVGISAYFPLSDEQHPSVGELMAGWQSSRAAAFRGHRWVTELATLAQRTGRPILFAEVGYRSIEFNARWPFDPVSAGGVDQQSQANAYQALLRTFENQPWWAGAIWWEWFGINGGAGDTSFNPRDKLVERFLTSWYREGNRPGDHASYPAPAQSVGPVVLPGSGLAR